MEEKIVLISRDYSENLKKFHAIDGIKAIALYGIYIDFICTRFHILSKDKLCTIGLNKTKLL